jgi:TetR/AcrR family transcriptional regulator, multidrug resistance operon repressor
MNGHSLTEAVMSKEDKREAILRATLELVAAQGFHDAPCSLIAERAGVAAGTIYRYFENKDVLINELYLTLEYKITTALLEGYTLEMPFRERFLHLVKGVLKFFITSPLEFKYMEQFHHSPYGVAFRRDHMLGQTESGGSCSIYSELFAQGVAQQVIKDLPQVILFDLAFGPIISVARNHILGFIQLDDNLVNQIAEACWDSLKR